MTRADGKMGPGTILPPTNQDVMDAVRGVHDSIDGLKELVAMALDARGKDVEQLRETLSKETHALREADRAQRERLDRIEQQLAELATIPSPPPSETHPSAQ